MTIQRHLTDAAQPTTISTFAKGDIPQSVANEVVKRDLNVVRTQMKLRYMKGIEAAIFDLDGTLLDTVEFYYQAFKHTFLRHGLPVRSWYEIVPIMSTGKTLEECYRYFSPTGDVSLLCETHRSFQEEHAYLAVPYPNTRETLKKLKEAEVKLAVVTTRSKRTSVNTVELAGIIVYLDTIISGEDTNYHKPHPEPVLKAIQQLKTEPNKAVMVGDTGVDILAGRSAGTRTIGVSFGYQGPQIAEFNPDFIIDDIADVVSIILSGTSESI